MWKFDEDPLDYRGRRGERPFASNIRIELPPPFEGGEKQSFPCWTRQYEVAVSALVGGTGRDYDYELVRILPTRLTKAAFLLWDSLPSTVQADYTAVKEKLQEAFGQRHFLDCFRANLSARLRTPGESLDVYAAEISKLVQEAFPGYGDVAQREEKFRRFLAGLDPALRAKCHEQGATDLEEALVIAGRCEMAREALKMDYGNAQIRQTPTGSGGAAMVHSISEGGGLYSAMDRLTEDMRGMRVEMRRMAEENNRLKTSGGRYEGDIFQPVRGGQCQCVCGEQGCQSRRLQGDHRGRSPDRGWRNREAQGGPGGRQEYQASYGDRTPSPNWRGPRPARGSFHGDSQRGRGVRFLSPKRGDPANLSGKEM